MPEVTEVTQVTLDDMRWLLGDKELMLLTQRKEILQLHARLSALEAQQPLKDLESQPNGK